mmetsp:Transcript_324/g.863  ORF Transcript_324/g.863 Transcript_324/m.863 type:complete len:249 (-) Transcript_324:173-919(-)
MLPRPCFTVRSQLVVTEVGSYAPLIALTKRACLETASWGERIPRSYRSCSTRCACGGRACQKASYSAAAAAAASVGAPTAAPEAATVSAPAAVTEGPTVLIMVSASLRSPAFWLAASPSLVGLTAAPSGHGSANAAPSMASWLPPWSSPSLLPCQIAHALLWLASSGGGTPTASASVSKMAPALAGSRCCLVSCNGIKGRSKGMRELRRSRLNMVRSSCCQPSQSSAVALSAGRAGRNASSTSSDHSA